MASLLTYTIIFAFMFIIMLASLTWTLYKWYQSQQCSSNPNIWCSDEWKCSAVCDPSAGKNPCFSNTTGIASCLFGPNSAIANKCTGKNGNPLEGECTCAIQGQNCLSGCTSGLPNIYCSSKQNG